MKISFDSDDTSIEIHMPILPYEILPVAFGAFPVLTGIYTVGSALVGLGISFVNMVRIMEEQTKYRNYPEAFRTRGRRAS